jgi:hypothetical protein
LLSAFTLAAGLGALAAAAPARAACVPVSYPAPATPPTVEVEGKISAYDRAARTITANGMTIVLPPALKIATDDVKEPTPTLTFEALVAPALEQARSIVGGTLIAQATAVRKQDPALGPCLTFEATSVFVELAENVVFGPITAVDPAGAFFRVNGVRIEMNADPRFPSQLVDVGGRPIAIRALSGLEGSLVTVEGYFDAGAQVLRAVAAEAEVVLPTAPSTDGVAIEKAEAGSNELRVKGTVGPTAQGAVAGSVTVFAGGANPGGTGCAGAALGSAAVDAATRSFNFRLRRAVSASSVCASSPLGGFAVAAVTAR